MIYRENEERAVLVGIQLPGEGWEAVEESVSELEGLAYTAGARVVGRLLQKKGRPDAATFLGRGKATELAELCGEVGADMVICDKGQKKIFPAFPQGRNFASAV